ncbi:MAG TPA: hypothetical protein VIH35_04585 [Kiritimatiellia bacterium]|jgi:hypothetical protein
MKRLLIVSLLSLASLSSFAAPAGDAFTEIAATNMDTAALSKRGKSVAESDEWKWKHGQTEHFVLHFENGIFAAKVARMAEFFYGYIAADLKGAKDQAPGRSHIFVFRNEKDWKSFKAEFGGSTEWAFSYVEGYMMYLQQAGDIQSSAEVLGHEMTHLVMNRFLTGHLPTWLNEGLAEWYGEFAYAAHKGVKKSRKTQFRGLKDPYPLGGLVATETYPKELKEVHRFYQTSKFLVAFLMLEKSPDKFLPFATDLAADIAVEAALEQHYGYAGIGALEADFQKFIK